MAAVSGATIVAIVDPSPQVVETVRPGQQKTGGASPDAACQRSLELMTRHESAQARPPGEDDATPLRPRRAAMAGAMLSIFASIFLANAPTPLYSYYQLQWDFSSGALAAAYAVFAVGVLAALFITAPVNDRLGRRRMLIPGMLLVVVSVVLFLYASSLASLMVARLISGLGVGAVTASAAATLVESDPAGNRRRAALIASLTFATATTTGPAISALCLYLDFWPAVAPYALALPTALLAGLFIYFAPETSPQANHPLTLRDWQLQRPHVPPAIRLPFITGALSLSLSWMTGGLFQSLGPSIARDMLLISNLGVAGMYAAVFQGIGGLSQLYFQSRPVQRSLTLGTPALFGGLCICVLSMYLASPLLFGMGTVVAAFGFGGAFAGGVAVVSMAAPVATRGEVFTAFYLVGYLAVSLPSLALGYAADAIGFSAAMVGFVMTVGIGMVVTLMLVARGHTQRPQTGSPES